jgi:hypothetical protein
MPNDTPTPPPVWPGDLLASPDALLELKQQLQDKRKIFLDDSNRHKKNALHLQLAIIVLAALTTVISAVGMLPEEAKQKEWFQAITVALGALSTLLTSWLALRNFRELWLLERQVFHALGDLQRAVFLQEKLRGGQVPAEQVLVWFESLNRILGAAGNKWAQLFAKEQEKKNSPHDDPNQKTTLGPGSVVSEAEGHPPPAKTAE